ncbi:MAG: HlyD family secretion protein, partial [Rhodospirillales bacterium]|nr:HlyD family secretion protein [Rhodospirillales bacterium]
ESIAPATGAEFALLPPQNASGNWVKVVQRLPIRLSVIDPQQPLALRAGMTATVSIETGHKRQLPSIVKQALALTERFQGK